jgi:small-conductance mechanosensitive channel
MPANFAALFHDLREALAWAPESVVATILLAAAAFVALLFHAGLLLLLQRTIARRRLFLRRLIDATAAPTRFALVIFALGTAAQVAPLAPELRTALTHILLLGFIALAGWIALIAVNLAASLYLRRFQIETADNLLARKHITQVRILERATETLVIIVTAAAALMTFDAVRQYGVSLFASAGVAGLIAGLAARPVLSNLIAGVQIAITQPIRLDDTVLVEGELGRIEDITSTYVVIRIWDLRRMIVPLSYFMEKPFQNWTREGSALVGAVFLYVDYSAPVDRLRDKLREIVKDLKLWDGEVVKLQVTDAKQNTMELRALVSARTSGDAFELRCEVREKLIAFLQQEIPQALPRERTETIGASRAATDEPGRARPPAGK